MCGCQRDAGRDARTADAGCKIDAPKKKELVRVIEQPASIEPFEETPLVAHIAGYVEKDLADIGKIIHGPKYDDKNKLIKPGDVLATLYIPEMMREWDEKKALVKQAKAQVDQAAAALEAAEANVLTAKAQVREAESNRAKAVSNHDFWKGQFTRFQEAVKDKVIDKQVLEETNFKYKAAEANLAEIEAKVQSAQASAQESAARRDKAKADVEAARANALVAEAAEGRLAALAEYRFIRAPFDGVVTRRNIHTGHYLQPGASGATNTIFVVARTDKLRIHADIPEADAMYLKDGLKGKIQPPVLKDQFFDGVVARTSWTLDSRSRTLRVEMDHVNTADELRPGMFANMIFNVNLGERWTLPSSAIFTHVDQPHCWRDVDGKAVRTGLKLGVRAGSDVEVLKMKRAAMWEAVTGNERVVVANLGAVSEGKAIPIATR
jgi:RND family efflux transporter MFP subunit